MDSQESDGKQKEAACPVWGTKLQSKSSIFVLSSHMFVKSTADYEKKWIMWYIANI